MLVAPRSVEYTRSLIAPLDRLDWPAVGETIAGLAARGRAVLREAGLSDDAIALELSADLRYVGQGFEVTVALAPDLAECRDAARLRSAFDAEYEARFGRHLGTLAAEVVSWRVRMIAAPAVSEIRFAAEPSVLGEALIERRPAYFEEAGGFIATAVYARARLAPGTRLAGPALIEEAESTAVIGPNASVEVDPFGNLIMRVGGREARSIQP
jgi:N-methylhydantoinase A